MIDTIEAVANNPWLNLLVGLALLASGISETLHELQTGAADLRLGTHHAISLFGLVTMFRALPPLLKGLSGGGGRG